MGITNTNKTVSKTEIGCGETFEITLSLTATPDIVANPVDIVLILDRSQSMAGSPLANLKNGAKKFVEIIDQATDGSADGKIGGGSRIGIVSFSDAAVKDTGLITSVDELDNAIDSLTAGGRTNHEDAFTKALELFESTSSNEKIMVMFTDGETTVGGDALAITATAKAQGVVIYCIGLSGNGGIDEQALNSWASTPASAHVAITPDDAELEDLFEDLAKNISKPGATDIIIEDKISDCFKITSLTTPTIGTASLVDAVTVKWEIDELGTNQSESAQFKFTAEHVGVCSGEIKVNEFTEYNDKENNTVTFPSPSITVNCDVPTTPDKCPSPVDIRFKGCEDSVEFDAGEVRLESQGRIVQIDVTLKNVCPNRRVALAVILTEGDTKCSEQQRGIKILTIPAHSENSCRDVKVKCIKFVLPDGLCRTADNCASCGERKLKARFIANYIDSDFECCDDGCSD